MTWLCALALAAPGGAGLGPNVVANPGFESDLASTQHGGAVGYSFGGWLGYAQSEATNPGPSLVASPVRAGGRAGQVLVQTVDGGGNGQFFSQDVCLTSSSDPACDSNLPNFDPNQGYVLDGWVYPVAGRDQILLQWGGDRLSNVIDAAGMTIDPTGTSFSAWGQSSSAPPLAYGAWHELRLVAHPDKSSELYVDGEFAGVTIAGQAVVSGAATQVLLGDDCASCTDAHQIVFDEMSLQQLPADTTAPTVSLTAPSDAAVVQNGAVLTTNASDDDSGVARVEYSYSANSDTFTPIGDSTAADYALTWKNQPADGTYTLRATAFDLSGNSSHTDESVTVDNAPPSITATCNTGQSCDGWFLSAPVTVAFALGGAHSPGQIHYTINAGDQLPYDNPIQLSDNGRHRIVAQSTDSLGATTTATFDVNIDGTPPPAPTLELGASLGGPVALGFDVPPPAFHVWFRPGAAGDFTVFGVPNDPESGLAAVHGYPDAAALGNGWSAQPDNVSVHYTFTADAIDPSEPGSGSWFITQTNGAGVEGSGSAPLSIDADSTAPDSVSITCNGAACGNSSYAGGVAVDFRGHDSQSGIGKIVYTTNGSDPSMSNGVVADGSTAYDWTPLHLTRPTEFRYRAYDAVGNEGPIQSAAIDVSTIDRIVYDEQDGAGNTNLFTVNPDGTGIQQITNVTGRNEGAQISPDRSKIVFGSNRGGNFQIYTMNADGTGVTQLTSGVDQASSPAYSPDGTKIAFTITSGTQSDVWVMDADGAHAHDVTNTPNAWEDQPNWSPTGTTLAFNVAPAQGADADVWVENLDGSGAVNLTPDTSELGHGNDHDPAWSPDGTTIAFVTNRTAAQPEVWSMNADGTNQHRLFSSFSADPAWSVDGSQIVFSYSPADGSYYNFNAFDTWVMGADGSNAHAVVANSVYDGFPNWGTAPPIAGGTPDPQQTGPAYLVNTADDHLDTTGCTVADCSLREALTAANNAEVAATIGFAILSGPQTISLGSALPTASVPVTIDGTTQPGVLAGPGITLDGIELDGQDGIVLGAPSSLLRGLVVQHVTGGAGVVVEGADSTVEGNVVSGNQIGIVVSGQRDEVVDNIVGSTAAGTASFPNSVAGIEVSGATGAHIGRLRAGNLVSGNEGPGILIDGGSTGTFVRANHIGTDANGDPADEGNAGAGVQVDATSPGNTIGGTAGGEGNRIADNGGAGVSVASSGNSILGNSIQANAAGIDLGTTGNQLQAAPLVASVRVTGSSLSVVGKFLSAAGTYRIEYFINDSCPDGGSSEGARFLGSAQAVVGAGGEIALNSTLEVANVAVGSGVTATATSPSGNTSSFSTCVTVRTGGTATSATFSLTTGRPTTIPGAAAIPLSAIPPSAFGNTSVDSNGATVAAPLGAIPLGAIPLGAIPLGAIPLGAIPLGAIGFTPQALVEDGLGGVPLNTIPLKAPLSWETELQGTTLEGVPAQTLTLRDVLTLQPPPANLTTPGPNAIGLKDLDLSLSPLGAIPLGAIALGSTPLGAIPISGDTGKTAAQNVADWCAQIQSIPGFATTDCATLAGQTVMGVAIQGVPLGAIPLGAIPLGAIPLGAIPLGAIPLGAIDLAGSPLGAIPLGAIDLAGTPLGAIPLGAIQLGASPLGAIPLGAIPVLSSVVDCTAGFDCAAAGATLATASAAGRLKAGATLADLSAYGAAVLADLTAYLQAHPEIRIEDVVASLPDTVTLHDLLVALMGGTPPSWELFPLDGLQAFAGAPGASGGLITYQDDFTIQGTGGAAVATLGMTMPGGARYVQGSAVLTDSTANTVRPVDDPVVSGSGLSWTLDTLVYGHAYALAFGVRPGFELGNAHASATLATAGLDAAKSAQADVTVGDTFEANDSPLAAPPISPSTLYVSYLGNGKDVDYSSLQINPGNAPAGTRIKIFLSHLHSDADLAVFGPVDAPLRSAPLGAIPLGAIPAGEQPVQLGPEHQQLSPDTAQDLPSGVLPAGDQLLGVSDSRGTVDEEVDLTSTGQTGALLIQVSSYDGHPTTDPYVIRVELDPPPALPPCTQAGPSGTGQTEATLPTAASIPQTARTLILFNEKRLGQYYNAADAHTVYTNLQAYAARSDVNGVIVPVESSSAVSVAYTAWDGNMCSPSAANGVVRAIGGLLDTLQAGHPDLKSLVVVGADNVIPSARVLDQTQQANELGFRSTFGFVNNEYVGAVAAGYLLSDDPYGDPDPQVLLGGYLYVPKLALGRLVETPADITRQLTAYIASDGLANPQTKLVSGYDFLTDGAQAVDAALGRTAATSLISEDWTADAMRGALFPTVGSAPLLDSLNAHYDQHRALSAQGNTNHDESAPSLFTTTDVKAHGASGVVGRIVFTMGCHAGFSLFDGLPYFTGTAPTDFAFDWPQAYLEGGAIEFMGNTGYGLGDTAAVAYSERLNQLFAQRLDGTMSVGEALEYAKQEYFGGLGVVSLYDAKVGNEATLYGIPTYRLGTGTPPAAPPSAPTQTDAATGLTSLEFNTHPTFTLHNPTLTTGTYYSADDPNGGGVQVTNRRPIEPSTSLDVTEPGATAHGVLLTTLTSHDPAGSNFVAAFGRVADDLSSIEPQLQGLVDFPASIQSLATIATPNGQRQRAVLIAGHFASGASAGVGRQRLYDTIGGTVFYSPSLDFVRPTITNMQVLKVGTTVGFSADVADFDQSNGAGTVKEAIVLYLDSSGIWQRANLTCSSGHCTGGGPLSGTSVDYIAQAVDAAGNVGVNANKATATNVVGPGGSQHLSISFGGATTTNGWFTAAVTATLASDDGASISSSLDGAAFRDGAVVPVDGDGLHTLDVRGSDGSQATFAIPIDKTVPVIRIDQPTNGLVILSGDVVRAAYSCSDAGAGIAAAGCVGTVSVGAAIDATAGTKTFTVTATDNVGRTATASVTYSVWQWTGFLNPVNNPPVLNVSNAGSAVPLKFQLGGDRGLTFLATGYPASQNVACDSGAPLDSVEVTVTAGASSLQYDSGANMYTYVWKTEKSWAGTCRDFTLKLPSGSYRTARFKFR